MSWKNNSTVTVSMVAPFEGNEVVRSALSFDCGWPPVSVRGAE